MLQVTRPYNRNYVEDLRRMKKMDLEMNAAFD
jgi:hypothetical protein